MGAIGVRRVETGPAEALVTARFGLSDSLVSAYDSASSSALGALSGGSFGVPMGNLSFATLDISPPAIGDPPIPDPPPDYVSQMQPVVFSDIEVLRNLLALVDVTVDQVTLPVLTAIEPTVSLPAAPSDILPTIPSDVPLVADPALPTVPSLDMPAVPVLSDIALPAAPTLDMLSFEGTMPTADLTPPEPMFVYAEGAYQSDLADALRTKLYNDVTLGGTGLSATVEQAIWDRALTRLNIELAKVYNQVLTNWGQWNYDMPDGGLSSALQEVMFEDTRARLDLDRDVAYKQADLAQQNTHFAITNGLVFEKQLMDYTNQVAQRAFDVARYRVQAIIDAFGVKISSYNARMEGYKALAQVFESRIRAELAKVEVYRAQMEGAKVQGELQVQKVQIYTARVQALNTLIDLYRAQMEGAKLQVDVDRAKIDGFRARLEAVIAQINGVTAKYNLYQAQIAGETAKVDLYGKQVTAFATQVQATKVEADINLAELQARVEGNKDKVAVLTAAIDKYKADSAYETSKEDAYARGYAAQVDGYTAEIGREAEYLKSRVESFRAQVSQVAARAELIVKEMDANLRAATAAKEIQMEALKTVALIQAQKVASALSSVSASAQLGFNASLSEAYSGSESNNFSESISDSTETSTQYIHHFNE